MKKVIIIHGPTASGKSSLALKLAKNFNGFLISADSRQVYRQLDIGTNKDQGQWVNGKYLLDNIEEYLIDIIEPNQDFSLADWLAKAKKLIKEKEKLAIVVGGTALYATALVQEYQLPGGGNDKLRKKLEKKLEKKGLNYLIKKIKKIDPNIETKIDIKNPRRVMRALEICLATGESFEPRKGESEFDILQLGIQVDREKLYQKINQRVDQMIKQGLVDEVKNLIEKYDKNLPAFTGIGYRQIIQHLDGKIDLAEAIRLIKQETRRYAKRQLTWYKKYPQIKWVKDFDQAKKIVEKFIS